MTEGMLIDNQVVSSSVVKCRQALLMGLEAVLMNDLCSLKGGLLGSSSEYTRRMGPGSRRRSKEDQKRGAGARRCMYFACLGFSRNIMTHVL